jgi:S-disulfanyl-L-cysteine oxidoreductase SoxD
MFSSRKRRTMAVIASQRVGAKRRPMTGSAKQSGGRAEGLDCFVASLLAMTAWVGLFAAPTLAAEAGHYGYGKPASPAEIAGWDIDVRGDDGAGLPPGKATVHRGAEVYAEQCAICHGTFGEGEGRFPKLAGGIGTLKHDRPELTVGSYWPFAPTLWDYINRAMPMQAPHTLSADDVYALTAYILHLNDIVSSDFAADRNTLPKVKMPNRDSFIWTDPRPDTTAEPCMSACAEPKDIKITSTAEGRNLTPRTTGPLDTMQPK